VLVHLGYYKVTLEIDGNPSRECTKASRAEREALGGVVSLDIPERRHSTIRLPRKAIETKIKKQSSMASMSQPLLPRV
jgi:hypothetical protein